MKSLSPLVILLRGLALAALTLVVFTSAVRAQSNCVAIPTGLISWWRAEGNAQDFTTNNPGTLVGNTTFGSAKVGQGFILDGTGDAVSLGSPLSLQRQSFTIEGWIRRSSTTAASTDGNVAGAGLFLSWGVNGYGLGIYNNGQLTLSKIGVAEVKPTVTITDTNWHHVAVTKSGSSVVFYVDGAAYPVAAFDPGFTFETSAAIGARADNLSNAFYGAIDELAFYYRALTASEILAIYNASSLGKCPVPIPPPACVPVLASNLVSWWPAEGKANDAYGENHGTLEGNVLFDAGEVGQTFDLNGTDADVHIPASPSLDVGVGDGFTIEGWINPANLNQSPIIDWSSAAFGYGIHIWLSLGPGGANTPGMLLANLIDTSHGNHSLNSVANAITTGVFQHIALTFNRTNGQAMLYINGSGVAQVNLGVFTPQTSTDLYLGYRAFGSGTGLRFTGQIDELALYNRVLTSDEVAAIYAAGTAGKCTALIAPIITAQPTNQTVLVGGAATFNVSAVGNAHLNYQWRFNQTNLLSGATNSSLFLSNLQLTNAGNYSVMVSNTVNSITSSNAVLTVNPPPPCANPPTNLVSWWRGEGDATDFTGNNNGVATGGVAYVVGKVGQAFSFNGSNSVVRVPAAPSLNIGAGDGFTIEGWINPADLAQRPIIEWNSATTGYGVLLTVSVGPGGANLPGSLYGGLVDTTHVVGTGSGVHTLNSSAGVLSAGVFQHIAMTFNRTNNGAATLYVNGAVVATASLGVFIPQTTADIYFGYRPFDLGAGQRFLGQMDEMTVYSRVLSSNEVSAIYHADLTGKCPVAIPPFFITQPTNQTVLVGTNTTFSVVAAGSQPLRFQWNLNTTNLVGATNTSLVLTNVQIGQAGNYSVTVSNVGGTATSSNAVLVVTPPPPCANPPTNLISWWRGEGDATDFTGNNPGTLVGNTTIVPAKVGQGFVFDGTADAVSLGNPANLQLQNFTIEAWIKRTSVTQVSFGSYGNGCIFSYGLGGYGLYLDPTGLPALSLIGISATSPGSSITDTNWHHLAVTKSGSNVVFYIDGILYPAPAYNPGFTFTTSVAIGARGDTYDNSFQGTIDELAVYSRALASNEVSAIYNANLTGKCPVPIQPFITTQPTNQTVFIGGVATFNVVASGSAPLSYQWYFNQTNILSGATSPSLFLSNLQLTNAGNYSVVISNAANSITSSNALLTVNPPPPCATPPTNLVSWWRGEGDATDFTGNNPGTLAGDTFLGFAKVGLGFVLDGSGDAVSLGNPASLHLQNFTIEAWIKRSSASLATSDGSGAAQIVSYGSNGYGLGMYNDGELVLSKIDVSGVEPTIRVTDTSWHHVAATKSGTNVVFYVDGVAYPAAAYSVTFTFGTPIAIGARGDTLANSFFGTIDELAIYNRALASNEVSVIYSADLTGKCPVAIPPFLITQPTNQTVLVGTNTTFSVVAAGSQPLRYQWLFNSTNIISGATNSSLFLSNLQLTNAGNYSVMVSNTVNSITSSNAVLTVNPPPPCANPPTNLVSWWRGEGDATDFTGNNNGVATGGVAYVVGKVGQAFSFNGSNSVVRVPAAPSLNIGAGDGFTIEGWINPADLAQRPIIEWNSATTGYGVLLTVSVGPGGANLPGSLYGGLVDTTHVVGTGSGVHTLNSSAGVLSAGVFQHIAMTFNRTNNGAATLYVNGAVVATASLGVFIPQTTADIYFGYRPFDLGAGQRFLGQMDEMTVYSRVLSSNEVSAIYHADLTGKCPVAIPPFFITQPTNQTVLVGTNTTFSVVAAGSQPLRYQWSLNTTNLVGATNTSLVLTNLQIGQAGNYSVTVSNGTAVTSSNALLTLTFPPALFRVVSVTGQIGQTVTVPVQLLANGNENTLGFSLNYDTNFLAVSNVLAGSNAPGAPVFVNLSQTPQGHVGAQLALAGGTTFNPGTQEVIRVNFTVVATPTLGVRTTSVVFADAPTGRQLLDGSTHTLSASYSNGLVTIPVAVWEGDTAPRPNGDQQLGITDWTQVGRFVAGLDTPNAGSEFQRADCAPRATLGDGVISVIDWVQAGRYGSGLDPLTLVGGPTNASSLLPSLPLNGPKTPGRIVRVVSQTVQAAATNTVIIQLDSLGNENALGFSLGFNPALLQYVSAAQGLDATGTAFFVNTNQLGSGKLGLVLALAPGATFSSGIRDIVHVSFAVPSTATGLTNIVFNTSPIATEVSDAAASPLTASYTAGVLTISPYPPVLRAAPSGTNILVAWPAVVATNFVLQVNNAGLTATNWSNVPATPAIVGAENVFTVTNPATSQFFRLYRPGP